MFNLTRIPGFWTHMQYLLCVICFFKVQGTIMEVLWLMLWMQHWPIMGYLCDGTPMM
jgi:hypothetical protein